MQCLLLATSKASPKDCKHLCKFLVKKMAGSFEDVAPPVQVDESEEEKMVSTIFQFDAPCRIVETMMQVSVDCAPKIFEKILSQFFVGKMVTLAILPLANFSVQRLLDFCSNKEQVCLVCSVLDYKGVMAWCFFT